jgi:hypothetical protein
LILYIRVLIKKIQFHFLPVNLAGEEQGILTGKYHERRDSGEAKGVNIF